MTITLQRPFIAIGPQQARLEAGWFDGMRPTLLSITVLEWQHATYMPQLAYLCIINIQVLKFVLGLTVFPERSSPDEYSFDDPTRRDCMNSD